MPKIYDISFDRSDFDDLPPDEKSAKELVKLLLEDSAGNTAGMGKYSSSEIHRCARKLIESGFIRGTVFDSDRCIWSRLTRKGFLYLKILRSKNEL